MNSKPALRMRPTTPDKECAYLITVILEILQVFEDLLFEKVHANWDASGKYTVNR